ncbi:uncharacterized protein [Littorina saxatilis]|uniref:EF-hand domain-containing protein n=1 Tax=Littorina saxatilis TaxID=31220 RepID=A0AAN9G3N3_9CAEN
MRVGIIFAFLAVLMVSESDAWSRFRVRFRFVREAVDYVKKCTTDGIHFYNCVTTGRKRGAPGPPGPPGGGPSGGKSCKDLQITEPAVTFEDVVEAFGAVDTEGDMTLNHAEFGLFMGALKLVDTCIAEEQPQK